jgi:hypothetical protein
MGKNCSSAASAGAGLGSPPKILCVPW